ncbi:bulb-type lectin domain-containing protein [Aspergillus pseudonomiae]|uniref:Lectin n=2 Tax=Aspergillus subgen. Circumdati TaxID=2720871 RepID=A0A0L1J5A9_ASPN3|nr:lectin [Aspergillus nomiae NRRL 13137]XP_031938062.1 bulb-type lectin domain-containing protein [Aspergillus pseudonomiae]KAB8257010.1 bulb-type lectin domain-containing protein [Aspergillus pseudonomiae]KAE8400743.1 bulb-type lectin domain-containing protein [Aspergillus pseudonomiae]KNG86986.1 lectin [Aspergillus nomiae NRRL 13137]
MPNTLGNGEWLEVGQSLWSQNGETELKMQEDGKIAVYVNGECVFQNTDEQRYDVKGIHMQPDGNLVMYDNNNTPLWHTDSTGSSDPSSVVCAVQNDGNVVLYTGQAIWATNTGR